MSDAMSELLSELNLVPESTLRDIVLGLAIDLPGARDYIEAFIQAESS